MGETGFEDLPTIGTLRTRVVGIALAVSTPATGRFAGSSTPICTSTDA